jgi:LPXTG-motif cell wall-anchored protein
VRRATLGALLAVLVGVATALAVAAPASADDDPIELSTDGVVWSTTLPGGLFDSFQGAVPGDSVTRSVSVRNPEDFEITLQTKALDVASRSSDLLSSITVDGEAGGRTLPAPVALSTLVDCATLAPDVVIGAHATTRVSITLALTDVDSSVAQSSQGGFSVLLVLKDNAAGPPSESCGGSIPGGGGGGDGGGGGTGGGGGGTGGGAHHPHKPGTAVPAITVLGVPLAFTGASMGPPLFLGGALIALGFLFLVARRRRREQKNS